MGTGYEHSARGDPNWVENNTGTAAAKYLKERGPFRDNPTQYTQRDVANGLARLLITTTYEVPAMAVDCAQDLLCVMQKLTDILDRIHEPDSAVLKARDLFRGILAMSEDAGVRHLISLSKHQDNASAEFHNALISTWHRYTLSAELQSAVHNAHVKFITLKKLAVGKKA